MADDNGALTQFRKVDFSTIPATIEEAFALSELAAGPLHHHGKVIAVVLDTGRPENL